MPLKIVLRAYTLSSSTAGVTVSFNQTCFSRLKAFSAVNVAAVDFACISLDTSPGFLLPVPAVSHQPDTGFLWGKGHKKGLVHSGFMALSLLTVPPWEHMTSLPPKPKPLYVARLKLVTLPQFLPVWSAASTRVRSLRSRHISCGCIYLKQPPKVFLTLLTFISLHC